MAYKKLWVALGVVLVIFSAVLGGVGVKVLTSAPPMSECPGAVGGRRIL